MSDARPLTIKAPPVQAPPRFSPPASTPAESEADASAEEPRRKHHDDGFLAAATLGGAFGSIAILILAPICIFAFTKVKGALVEEEPVAVVAAEPAPAPVEVAPVPEEPEIPAIDVVWPEIVLTGILAGDQGRAGSVILNGKVVNLNQVLLGVRVTDFTSQQVVLQYQGAQKTLRVGGSTL